MAVSDGETGGSVDDNRPLPIVMGGLFRCCIETWETIAPRAGITKQGDTLDCSYCDAGMIVRDGAWQWNEGYSQAPRP